MIKTVNQQTITCICPSGDQLRGDVAILGKQVACPKCGVVFAFGDSGKVDVSDTAVMRILNDAPILSQQDATMSSVTRPCQRCGAGVSDQSTVCESCNSYVGQLPTFLQQLLNSEQVDPSK